jgi:lipoprotein-releasing system permease protein
MHFAFYIARRYLISKSRSNAINIITGIAALGIVVGAMSLFVVLSVFSGLRNFSLSFSGDFDPDVQLVPKTGKYFTVSGSQQAQIGGIQGVSAFSKVIEERVLFRFNDKEKVAYLKGVDANYSKVNNVKSILYNGQWLKTGTSQAVVGYAVADDLSMGLFDFNNVLEAYVPKPGKGNIDSQDAFVKSDLMPIGIYAINEDLDGKYVFTDIGLAQELLHYGRDQVSSIEVKLKPAADGSIVIGKLSKIFPGAKILDRAQQNESLYRMLNTENLAVYLIFTLVIIIALFNLIGALIMIIIEKKGNLKTLSGMGAEVRDLRKIFWFQGSLLTVAGGFFGLLLGIAIVVVQQKFQLVMITKTLAYPIVFRIENLLIVLATIFVLGMAASWIAASRVNRKFLD